MSEPVDQADGLRRLLTAATARKPRIIAFASMSAGAGATTAAMNVSVEIARHGQRVLLLDEHGSSDNSASSIWGLRPAGTLEDVAMRRMDVVAAAARCDAGVTLLPAPVGSCGRFDPRCVWMQGVIVVDVAFDAAGQLSALARMADDLVVVLQPSVPSITTGYARLKRLQYTHALQTFQVVVNAVASAQQAQTVLANIVDTSSRFLTVSLCPLGWVTSDALVRDAARAHKTVCEAHAGSAVASEYRRIAATLLKSEPVRTEGLQQDASALPDHRAGGEASFARATLA